MNDIYFSDGEAKWITLTYEDDTEVQCAVIDIFEAAPGQRYIVLIEEELIEAPDGQAFLYRYDEDENGDPILTPIEDDAEYDMAANLYEELAAQEM